MSRRRRKPPPSAARYLAPAAFLAGITIAVLLVHAGLQGGTAKTTTSTQFVVSTAPKTTTKAVGPKKRFYTVQTGDTFGTIASKVGISVDQLQALNPGVSSTALQVGQKLRIK